MVYNEQFIFLNIRCDYRKNSQYLPDDHSLLYNNQIDTRG